MPDFEIGYKTTGNEAKFIYKPDIFLQAAITSCDCCSATGPCGCPKVGEVLCTIEDNDILPASTFTIEFDTDIYGERTPLTLPYTSIYCNREEFGDQRVWIEATVSGAYKGCKATDGFGLTSLIADITLKANYISLVESRNTIEEYLTRPLDYVTFTPWPPSNPMKGFPEAGASVNPAADGYNYYDCLGSGSCYPYTHGLNFQGSSGYNGSINTKIAKPSSWSYSTSTHPRPLIYFVFNNEDPDNEYVRVYWNESFFYKNGTTWGKGIYSDFTGEIIKVEAGEVFTSSVIPVNPHNWILPYSADYVTAITQTYSTGIEVSIQMNMKKKIGTGVFEDFASDPIAYRFIRSVNGVVDVAYNAEKTMQVTLSPINNNRNIDIWSVVSSLFRNRDPFQSLSNSSPGIWTDFHNKPCAESSTPLSQKSISIYSNYHALYGDTLSINYAPVGGWKDRRLFVDGIPFTKSEFNGYKLLGFDSTPVPLSITLSGGTDFKIVTPVVFDKDNKTKDIDFKMEAGYLNQWFFISTYQDENTYLYNKPIPTLPEMFGTLKSVKYVEDIRAAVYRYGNQNSYPEGSGYIDEKTRYEKYKSLSLLVHETQEVEFRSVDGKYSLNVFFLFDSRTAKIGALDNYLGGSSGEQSNVTYVYFGFMPVLLTDHDTGEVFNLKYYRNLNLVIPVGNRYLGQGLDPTQVIYGTPSGIDCQIASAVTYSTDSSGNMSATVSEYPVGIKNTPDDQKFKEYIATGDYFLTDTSSGYPVVLNNANSGTSSATLGLNVNTGESSNDFAYHPNDIVRNYVFDNTFGVPDDLNVRGCKVIDSQTQICGKHLPIKVKTDGFIIDMWISGERVINGVVEGTSNSFLFNSFNKYSVAGYINYGTGGPYIFTHTGGPLQYYSNSGNTNYQYTITVTKTDVGTYSATCVWETKYFEGSTSFFSGITFTTDSCWNEGSPPPSAGPNGTLIISESPHVIGSATVSCTPLTQELKVIGTDTSHVGFSGFSTYTDDYTISLGISIRSYGEKVSGYAIPTGQCGAKKYTSRHLNGGMRIYEEVNSDPVADMYTGAAWNIPIVSDDYGLPVTSYPVNASPGRIFQYSVGGENYWNGSSWQNSIVSYSDFWGDGNVDSSSSLSGPVTIAPPPPVLDPILGQPWTMPTRHAFGRLVFGTGYASNYLNIVGDYYNNIPFTYHGICYPASNTSVWNVTENLTGLTYTLDALNSSGKIVVYPFGTASQINDSALGAIGVTYGSGSWSKRMNLTFT